MRFLVWVALAVAGVGYWFHDYRRWQKAALGRPSDMGWSYGETDAQDTAAHVARILEQ